MDRRTTHRRSRASQRQTHKYRQVGGVRTVGLAELQRAFKETGIVVTDTPFAFLADDDWFSKPTTAANYMTLIANQNTLFQIAYDTVLKNMGLVLGATDIQIMDAIKSKSNEEIGKQLTIFKSVLNLIILNDFWNIKGAQSSRDDRCGSTNKTKFDYNLYRDNEIPILKKYCATCDTALKADRSGLKENFYNIATVLLHPIVLQNTTITAIANILRTLEKDTDTLTLIKKTDADKTIGSFSTLFLIEKYISYINSSAYYLTSDMPRDSLFLWGCKLPEGGFWEDFFIRFLSTVKENSQPDINTIFPIQSPTAGTSTLNDAENISRFGTITAIVYKNQDKSVEDILRLFVGEPVVGAIDNLTGMLPSSEWDNKLFESEPPVTFRHLLRRLKVTEIHYLIHLVYTLNELAKSDGEIGLNHMKLRPGGVALPTAKGQQAGASGGAASSAT